MPDFATPIYQSFSQFSATRKIKIFAKLRVKLFTRYIRILLSRITGALLWVCCILLSIYRCWIICLSTLKYILGNAAYLYVYSWRRLQFNWRMCPLKNNFNIPRLKNPRLKRKLNFWHWNNLKSVLRQNLVIRLCMWRLLRANQDISCQALKPHFLEKQIRSFFSVKINKHPWSVFRSSCGTWSSALWKCCPVLNG